MSRLTRKRARQWARYVNHYEPTSYPAVGGNSFLRVIWRGMYRQDPRSYAFIRRQAKHRSLDSSPKLIEGARKHKGLCGQGQADPCFEDDFTEACSCWCHQTPTVNAPYAEQQGGDVR